MYLRYGMLAEYVGAGERGKKSVIGILDIISAKEFPARRDQLVLFVRLEGHHNEIGRHMLEVEFLDADFQKVGDQPPAMEFELKGGGRPVEHAPVAAEFIINVRGLLLPAVGDYEFAIRVDGRTIGSVPLYVLQGRPAE